MHDYERVVHAQANATLAPPTWKRRAFAIVVNVLLVLTSLDFGLAVLLWSFEATDMQFVGTVAGIIATFAVYNIAARWLLPLAYRRPLYAVLALVVWVAGLRLAIAGLVALPKWVVVGALLVLVFFAAWGNGRRRFHQKVRR